MHREVKAKKENPINKSIKKSRTKRPDAYPCQRKVKVKRGWTRRGDRY
jgi:hypothetical protein